MLLLYTFSWTTPLDMFNAITQFKLTCVSLTNVGEGTPKTKIVNKEITSANFMLNYTVTYKCQVVAGSDIIFYEPSMAITIYVTEAG